MMLWIDLGVIASMTENRCVICGAIVPEGTQVCPICEEEIEDCIKAKKDALRKVFSKVKEQNNE